MTKSRISSNKKIIYQDFMMIGIFGYISLVVIAGKYQRVFHLNQLIPRIENISVYPTVTSKAMDVCISHVPG
jgi:hypothetical protein